MKRLSTLLNRLVMVGIIAMGLSKSFLSAPSPASNDPVMNLISFWGSLVVLIAFLMLSWNKSVSITQVYCAMMLVNLLGAFLSIAGFYDGAFTSFGIVCLFISLMLTSIPLDQSIVIVIAGLGCAGLVYPSFHLLAVLPNSHFDQIVSIALVILATAFMILDERSRPPFPPAKSKMDSIKALRKGVPDSIVGRVPVIALLTIPVVLFASFGMFEIFIEKESLGHIHLGTLLIPLATSVALLLVAKKLPFPVWSSIVFCIAWIASICLLLTVLVRPEFLQTIFEILTTIIVVLHVIAWLTALDIAQATEISPLFLFAAITLIAKTMQFLGRLICEALNSANYTTFSSMEVAACALAVFSISVGIAVLRQLCKPNNLIPSIASKDRNKDASAKNTSFSWSKHCVATCTKFNLSQREIEIVSLYCQGRSAADIGNDLHLAESTVRTYIRRAYEKLGVRNKKELFEVIVEEGEEAVAPSPSS